MTGGNYHLYFCRPSFINSVGVKICIVASYLNKKVNLIDPEKGEILTVCILGKKQR